jgi:hypothetical protein
MSCQTSWRWRWNSLRAQGKLWLAEWCRPRTRGNIVVGRRMGDYERHGEAKRDHRMTLSNRYVCLEQSDRAIREPRDCSPEREMRDVYLRRSGPQSTAQQSVVAQSVAVR